MATVLLNLMAYFDPCLLWKWGPVVPLPLSTVSLPGFELASISALSFAGCCCSVSISGCCNVQLPRPGFSPPRLPSLPCSHRSSRLSVPPIIHDVQACQLTTSSTGSTASSVSSPLRGVTGVSKSSLTNTDVCLRTEICFSFSLSHLN